LTYKFSNRSIAQLATAHPDLSRVFYRALLESEIDFAILEGVRSLARQKILFAKGVTRTLKSRHLPSLSDGLSRAVDVAPIVNGEVSWDWTFYDVLAQAIKTAAKLERVPIEWGGDWITFRDGPHWQLPVAIYP
jgi:peptidoglycan L-alanyl-D-glutamate endopeptidase CwlK